MSERFFYATESPHKWSSGPLISSLRPDTFEEIFSLQEAKEVAEGLRRGRFGQKEYVKTSYGIIYETEALDG